ncbi:MAG: hypothetical protein GF400_01290 [Candidatus Eisenbacteria bacterium]|nr:hypothetical protein [Candidatus Eisenbacteria bacterium]
MIHRAPLLLLVVLAVCCAGCARSVPMAALDAGGADVGVAVRLRSGEVLRGRLISLTDDELLLDTHHRLGVDVRLEGSAEARRVEVRGEAVPGDFVGVESGDTGRIAVVRRALDADEVARASFYRPAGEASLGPILSTFIGPGIGLLLALAI